MMAVVANICSTVLYEKLALARVCIRYLYASGCSLILKSTFLPYIPLTQTSAKFASSLS
jgi:hypothetical protein